MSEPIPRAVLNSSVPCSFASMMKPRSAFVTSSAPSRTSAGSRLRRAPSRAPASRKDRGQLAKISGVRRCLHQAGHGCGVGFKDKLRCFALTQADPITMGERVFAIRWPLTNVPWLEPTSRRMYWSPSHAISACSRDTSAPLIFKSAAARRPIVNNGLSSGTTRFPCESITLSFTSDIVNQANARKAGRSREACPQARRPAVSVGSGSPSQHLDAPVHGERDVRRLQIAVDDTLLVRGLECLGKLARADDRHSDRNRSAPHPIRERLAFHVCPANRRKRSLATAGQDVHRSAAAPRIPYNTRPKETKRLGTMIARMA